MREELLKGTDLRGQYLLQLFGHESDLHKKIEAKSKAEGVIGMQISAYEGQMIKLFAQLISARKIIEIGCLYGYSALWLLEVLPEDGELYLLELDETRVAWMKENFRNHPRYKNIHWFTGDALQNLKEIQSSGPFDLCFIDANKGAYSKYLDWAESAVRKGGLILGDNSFLWGAVYDSSSEKSSQSQVNAMKEFNQRLADKDRYLSTLVPTEEGLTVAQKLF